MNYNEQILFTALCNNRNNKDYVAVTHDLLDSIRSKIHTSVSESFSHIIYDILCTWSDDEYGDGTLTQIYPYIYHISDTRNIRKKSTLGQWYLDLYNFN